MNLPTNDWNRIRQHYAGAMDLILAEQPNEWAIDAYAWEDAGIHMTPIEVWLWADIRQAGVVMYPQFPVAGFFVDFGNPRAKVAIECDGRDYHLDKQKDIARDRVLEGMGWTVYRLTGSECRQEFDDRYRIESPGQRLMQRIADNHRVQRSRSYA